MEPAEPRNGRASDSAAGGTPSKAEPVRFTEWLEWLPWEKILIWGLFLTVVYALRHFFFIIFMTFITAYIMRSAVKRLSGILSPRRESVWLERVLTLVCFALLLFGLYKGAEYLGPRLFVQARTLVERATSLDPRKELDNFMTKTVGAYFFQRTYGGRDDPRYRVAFEERFKQGDQDLKAFQAFPALEESIQKKLADQERRRIREGLAEGAQSEKEFESWFLKEKAPQLFAADRERAIEEDEKSYNYAVRAGLVAVPLEELKKKPDFEQAREERILRSIMGEQLKDPTKHATYRKEWEDPLVETTFLAFKGSPDYLKALRDFYEKLRANPATLPDERPTYTFDKFIALSEAYAKGQSAFFEVFREGELVSEKDRVEQEQSSFEYEEQRRLARAALESETAKTILTSLNSYVDLGVQKLTGWVRDAAVYLFTIPVQLALSLLLSFFITIDIFRMRKGVLKLRESRFREFFDEIAPGLYNFGRLIGRAFQAQGVIALFNTVLTFFAIRFLGIQNEVFLCGIVFFCSFIPVLGVVLSSLPIAVMAIVQPGGSLYVGLQAILAILVIHFIETSVLNPKILGDMLHLHPVMVLTVLAVGEHFFGVWGLLLGVPVAVFIIRCVILNEEIPGLIEQSPLALLGTSPGEASPQVPEGSFELEPEASSPAADGPSANGAKPEAPMGEDPAGKADPAGRA